MSMKVKRFWIATEGASLVEYAIALIVVTLIGGSGMFAIGNNTVTITAGASDSLAVAYTEMQKIN